MEFLLGIIDIFLHLDRHLNDFIVTYGVWTYAILFLIIFAETGLVVTPFLPGDSLLFAAGALSAGGVLSPWWLCVILVAAAILGDSTNYAIGNYLGPRAFQKPNSRVFKKQYLDQTHQFYDRYGGRTIIVARFVPIVRTFAPFVAGVGTMSYARFMNFNVVGAVAWVAIFVWGGYWFGNIPIVQRNFGLVVIVVILLSVVPIIVEWIKHRSNDRRHSQ